MPSVCKNSPGCMHSAGLARQPERGPWYATSQTPRFLRRGEMCGGAKVGAGALAEVPRTGWVPSLGSTCGCIAAALCKTTAGIECTEVCCRSSCLGGSASLQGWHWCAGRVLLYLPQLPCQAAQCAPALHHQGEIYGVFLQLVDNVHIERSADLSEHGVFHAPHGTEGLSSDCHLAGRLCSSHYPAFALGGHENNPCFVTFQ